MGTLVVGIVRYPGKVMRYTEEEQLSGMDLH